MPNDKKTKFYKEPKVFIQIKTARLEEKSSKIFLFFFHIGNAVYQSVSLFARAIFKTCYHVGNAIISVPLGIIYAILNEFKKTKNIWLKRLALAKLPDFSKTLGVFGIISILSLAGVGTLRLVARGFDLKGAILGASINGGQYLEDAKTALEKQDFEEASTKFLLAYQSFSSGQKQLQDTSASLLGILNVVPQANGADKILQAATLISSSGTGMVELYKNVGQLTVTPQGLQSTGEPTAKIFTDANSQIAAILTKINLAQSDLESVNPSSFPSQYQALLLSMKESLDVAKNSLTSFRDVFSLFSGLVGGPKNLLVLFENNNELRPTGGFMGTFGYYKMADGQINSTHISSIYDLDGQLKEKIVPPTPILAVNDRWYLRDSNWFANFPDSAKTISSFYEKEAGETPDAILAISPQFIIDLLKLTGPVTLPNYDITLTSDNFVELTQVASTMSNDTPENKPKQVLADLFPVLLQKIAALDKTQIPVLLQDLQNNLNAKQIVLYSNDPGTEAQLAQFNWSGQVALADRDYLSVVSSNLGGTKTDLYMNQDISLKTSVDESGSITNELTITRKNTLPKLSETNNESYVRIFVPQGSTLISNTGFDYKDLSTVGLQQDPSYKTDPNVLQWEKNSVRDVVSGTVVGQEAGKTYFGNWLNVDGGETKTITVTYKLPFTLKDLDHYSLTLQKQMGTLSQNVRFTVQFPNRSMVWKNFDTGTAEANNFTDNLTLDRDYFLGMVFQKR